MAYVLMHTFRQRYLKGTQYARAQFDTIRLKVIKIGVRVRQLSTKVKIHLPCSFPLKEELWKIDAHVVIRNSDPFQMRFKKGKRDKYSYSEKIWVVIYS